ncbi:hypothetical protein LVD17_12295 [Fulvivirga ulvae]|uniref:hypothetical protein n=1 Tax=Fulvivirga ulvae TaxID=2904245 RepID=UPI001F274362|nr:hypothetical protein [Fulvivirga ulvae]UII34588.1 hypothetical protein LVD17_12295 [Fulvivirga ulvae]
MNMVFFSKIFRCGMLLVGFLTAITFSFGSPAKAAIHGSDDDLSRSQQTLAGYQQFTIDEQALHILNSHFDIEESAEEDLDNDFNTTFTGYKTSGQYFGLRSGLNTGPGILLHPVRYYVLYCCPKIPSLHS